MDETGVDGVDGLAFVAKAIAIRKFALEILIKMKIKKQTYKNEIVKKMVFYVYCSELHTDLVKRFEL